DYAGGGQSASVVNADGPIEPIPRAAVGVDQADQRRARLTLGTVDAREEVLAARSGVDDVGFLDFVRRARIEANGRGHDGLLGRRVYLSVLRFVAVPWASTVIGSGGDHGRVSERNGRATSARVLAGGRHRRRAHRVAGGPDRDGGCRWPGHLR